MDKTGKDIVVEYTKKVLGEFSEEYIFQCREVLRTIDSSEIDYSALDGMCPSFYGLDEFDGLCHSELEPDDIYIRDMCIRCWKKALE